MGLGTQLVITPSYDGHKFKDAIGNAQTRIDELLNGQNELNSDTKIELDKTKSILNDIVGFTSTTTADFKVDDVAISVAKASGFEADDKITILDDEYIIDSVTGNTVALKSGLLQDVPTGTEVIKNSTLNIESVNDKIQTLADIFSKTGTANDVFDALVLLANSWNKGNNLHKVIKGSFDSETGELNVDLTDFNFKTTADYDVTYATNSFGARVSSIGADKVDEKTVKIIAWDDACFVEDGIFYNAKENPFDFTLVVHYKRPTISFSIADEDGTVTSV